MTKVRDDINAIIKGLSNDSETISIIGNGRKSGKSMAFKTFLNVLSRNYNIGISSFGNDRTQIKSIGSGFAKNGLIYIKKGTIVATSRNSLAFSDFTKEILMTTGINTPLGEIVVIRALSSGYVLLTGASTIGESIQLKKIMKNFGAEKILFDGSLNRRSPASPSLSDSIALAFAITPNIKNEIQKEIENYRIDGCSEDLKKLPNKNCILTKTNDLIPCEDIELEISNVLDHYSSKIQAIRIAGALQSKFVKAIIHLKNSHKSLLSDSTIIIEDATKLFIDKSERIQLSELGIKLKVINQISVNSIFLNPYGTGYTPSETDAIMSKIDYGIPVFDIVRGVYFGRI